VANKRIAHLDLQMNQLTDAGLKRLAGAVPHSGIAELHVANNSVTEAGARALVDAAALQHRLVGRTMTISGISDSILAAARRRCPSEATDLTAPGDGGVTAKQDKVDGGGARKEEEGAEAAGVSNGARDKASEAQALETTSRTRMLPFCINPTKASGIRLSTEPMIFDQFLAPHPSTRILA
jgi:hypothetical protein